MNTTLPRHPFLDDLDENVELVTSVLNLPVHGRDAVLKVVKAGAAQYRTQKPIFLGTTENKTFFEYEAELQSGLKANGLVSIQKNEAGKVTQLHIAFSPLSAMLEVATSIRPLLAGDFSSKYFEEQESV